VDCKGTQPYIHVYPYSPKLPSHPGCHIILSRILCAIKDRNGRDLTEAEDIKKWQEYTEELYKKDLHDPDNHDGVITDLEPDILDGRGVWESMDTRVCMAESLCSPPKTITTLLIGFTPIQNILGVKKIIFFKKLP